MPAPTIAEMLKYANLQMASEALFEFDTKVINPAILPPGNITTSTGHYSGPIDSRWLTTGNEHASRFAPTEAAKFVAQWEVVDHLANTTTGFSGTLFKNKSSNELTISFRSTEFIDDVARDCVATNSMEIKAYGWAFGQIADMEAWYAKLKAGGKLPASAKLDVTGYSLGGHLATAFNLLHQNELNGGQVITFNGAGVGQLRSGATLKGVIDEFNDLRKNPSKIALQFTDTRLRDVFLSLSARIKGGEPVLPSDYTLLNSVVPDQLGTDYQQQQFANEKTWIRSALDRIKTLQTQVARISLGQITDSVDGAPAKIPDRNVEQEYFDYQMAVLKVQEKTVSKSVVTGAYNALFDNKSPGNPQLANQYDIVGKETTTSVTAMVSNSQWHHGTNVDVFIEDQPQLRGSFAISDVQTYWDAGSLVPINQYTQNDFGDTHSLPLIVDSLNIQNALLQLVPEAKRQEQSAAMTTYLKAASALKAESATGTQGKAEGDALEWVLDGLVKLFTNTDSDLHDGTAKNGASLTTGGTWADETLRNNFYTKLALLNDKDKSAFSSLAGKFKLGLPSSSLASAARTDFASLLTLLSLSPVAIQANTGEEDAVATALGAKWGDAYTAWRADKGLSPDLRASQANYTDRYLADRAAFLSGLSMARQANTGEGKALRADTGGDPAFFEDKDSGLTLQTQSSGSGQGASGPNYRFGGTDNDSFSGTDQIDHFYGGGGTDNLDGGKGNDYLEGNADNDTLSGGEGQDSLLGGVGDDVLTGGKGDDSLSGGQGDDTYKFTSGDGWDWIEDQDGVGHIEYDNVTLSGGEAVDDSGLVWQKKDVNGEVQFTYILTDWTENGETFKRLSIEGENGGMYIKNWKAGQLGISLAGAKTPVRAPAILTQVGVQGTLFSGDASDNIIVGGGGSDVLAGGQGKDRLEGGAGTDYLIGDGSIIRAANEWYARPPIPSKDYPDFNIYDFKNFVLENMDGTLVPDPDHPGLNSWELATVGDDDILLGGAGDGNVSDPFGLEASCTGLGGGDMLNGRAGDDTYVVKLGKTSRKCSSGRMLRSTGENGQKRNPSHIPDNNFWEMAA